MRVTISSASDDLIDEKYKKAAEELTDFLASNNCDLAVFVNIYWDT